jgi:alpha-ketoglutarate-dependent taurine dioxygenase
MIEPGDKAMKKKGMSLIGRQVIDPDLDAVVQTAYLEAGSTLPLVIRPAVRGLDLIDWAKRRRRWLEDKLLQHGALLFRGFEINSPQEFERVIAAICDEAMPYQYRASPRTQIVGNIYTSTDYPADQSIFPHNEHAYSPIAPMNIFFYCAEPAAAGGETPIGSGRRIFQRIPAEIAQRFIEKGVMYVRNFGDGFGLPWQTVFQTEDKALIAEYCRVNGLQHFWKGKDRLRTRQVGPAVIRHPRTGELVWFNHATFFHASTLESTVRDALFDEFADEDMPNTTFYGDGACIDPETLDQLRAAYVNEMVVFKWEKRDILLLDNFLTVHGRKPYVGARRILVGMANPVRIEDLRDESDRERSREKPIEFHPKSTPLNS